MLAVAVANGSIMLFDGEDATNLKTFFSNEREVIVVSPGECTCLSWNPAFDEEMALVVGCKASESSLLNLVTLKD